VYELAADDGVLGLDVFRPVDLSDQVDIVEAEPPHVI